MASEKPPMLPQHDDDPATRATQLDEARMVYEYDFELVPTVAMAWRVPRGDRGSVSWLGVCGRNSVRVNGNELANRKLWTRGAAGSRGGGDDEGISELEEHHEQSATFFDEFEAMSDPDAASAPTMRGGTAKQSMEQWIDEASHRIGELTPVLKPPPEPDEEVGDEPQESRGFVANLLARLGPCGRPSSITDFEELYSNIAPIPLVDDFRDDGSFARLAVAGWNPMMIEGVDRLPDHFAVSQQQFRHVMGDADSLERAGAEGRLYMSDYELLEGLVASDTDGVQKYSYAPLCLYARPDDGRFLRPVAIQCNQTPDAKTNPVYTATGDPWRWQMAKTIVSVADANYHELASHLARTHLLVQPAVMAMHRHLSRRHPLYQLLSPHIEGTLYINNMAAHNLIAPGGDIDLLFAGSIESSRAVAIQGLATYDFSDGMLPRALAKRRVADADALPFYPYRDDGMRVWNAIESWVRAYLSHSYRGSDAEVHNDSELRGWANQLAPQTPGGLLGFGPIDTLDQLVAAVTMFVFTASAQHAVVNFAQWDLMSYAPATTGAVWSPMPEVGVEVGEESWLDMLPPLELAERQIGTLYELGNVYYTRLGQYEADAFGDPLVRNELLPAFRSQLEEVESAIRAANEDSSSRPWPFEFLLPSKIPQSINI